MLAELGRIALGLGALAIAGLAARSRRAEPDALTGAASLDAILRQRPAPRRRPPEAGLPAMATPPQGPLPTQGGAAAPLTFES